MDQVDTFDKVKCLNCCYTLLSLCLFAKIVQIPHARSRTQRNWCVLEFKKRRKKNVTCVCAQVKPIAESVCIFSWVFFALSFGWNVYVHLVDCQWRKKNTKTLTNFQIKTKQFRSQSDYWNRWFFSIKKRNGINNTKVQR